MLAVRDPLSGRLLFYIEGQVARDADGKAIGERVQPSTPEAHSQEAKLAADAARLMTGRLVTMDLAPGDVATAATQASFGLGEGQQDWVADQVSAVKLISKDRGVWYPENAADAVKLVQPVVAGDASPPVVSPSFTPVSFVSIGYALATKLPRGTADNADFNLRERSLRFLVEALRRAREFRVATLLATAANYAAGNQVAAAAKWNGGVTPTPLIDLFNALAASYLPANLIVMPENVSPYFFANSSGQVRDYVQAHGDMPWHVTAKAKYFNAGLKYIWAPTLPTNVAVIRTGDPHWSTSFTFRWLGDSGADGAICDGMLVRTYFDARDGSEWIVVAHYDDEVIVSNQIGAIITGATQ